MRYYYAPDQVMFMKVDEFRTWLHGPFSCSVSSCFPVCGLVLSQCGFHIDGSSGKTLPTRDIINSDCALQIGSVLAMIESLVMGL